jgi:hypothetical protein
MYIIRERFMRNSYLIILAVIIAVTIIVSIFLFAMLGPIQFTETTGPAYLSPTQVLPLAEQLNSTSLLLHEPIGGFRGPLRWISEPANVTWDYEFYSRNYGPGNVTLSVYEVRNPLNTTPVQPTPGISARMIPDRFTTVPGSEVTSQLVVNITSEGYSHNSVTRPFYVHAEVEGEWNAVAYDWIRVRMGDRPISYTSYQTKGDISNSNITIHRGDRRARPPRGRVPDPEDPDECLHWHRTRPDAPFPPVHGCRDLRSPDPGIRTTAFDAAAYNYPVVLAVDATGAQTEEIHEANIYDMQNIGVRILTTRDLIATL